MAKPRVQIVTAQYIRKRFNESNILQRLQTGQLTSVIKRNGHPSPPKAKLPNCTHSQVLVYLDGKKAVAIVHQCVLPDGTLAAVANPTPKWCA